MVGQGISLLSGRSRDPPVSLRPGAPNLVEQIFATIEKSRSEGTSIQLVEQNANMALEIATRDYIMQTGEIVLADASAALRDNEDVKRAYLGA